MRKFALLIGVSQSSEEDLPELPSAIEDIRAMQAVLQNPEIGGFDSVAVLPNPTRQEMEEAIETLFANCKKEDLVLFYFSGHGITDEKGKLYLVMPQTRKERGNLIKATAVAATVLHDNMDNSRSKRQVLILDSCFSGAIAEGLTGKSAESKVDIQKELGGEGRAILTSSNAVQKSFHIKGYNLSIYTHYLIDGIQTGAANQDGDNYISVDELHEYAKKKLEQEAPSMSPQFFPVKEGYKIRLVRSPKPKGDLEYRKQAERLATPEEFTIPAKRILMELRLELGISDAKAEAIEVEVLRSHQEYRKKQKEYYDILREILAEEEIPSPKVVKHLAELYHRLGLKEEDAVSVEREALNGYSLNEFITYRQQKIEQDKSDLNLSKPLPLTAKEMSEGSTKDILLDDDQNITVTIPAGVKEGQKLRIRGKGRIDSNTQVRGDLYLIIQHDASLAIERPESNSAVSSEDRKSVPHQSNKLDKPDLSCQVFVQRTSQLTGRANKWNVDCDGKFGVSGLASGCTSSFTVEPGEHEFKVYYSQWHAASWMHGDTSGYAEGNSNVLKYVCRENTTLILQCYYAPMWNIKSWTLEKIILKVLEVK